MAQGLNNENKFGYEQFLFINGNPIHGVQSFQTSYNLPKEAIFGLGSVDAIVGPRGAKGGQVTVQCVLVGSDQFFHLTGTNGVNGYLLKDLTNKFDNYGFISGYLTNYSHQYSLGSLPEISATFSVFNNMGTFTNSSTSSILNELNNLNYTSTGYFNEIHQGCASFSINDFQDNQLLSYSISTSCQRAPIFNLGSDLVKHVILRRPIDRTVTLQFEEGIYTHFNMKGYPYSPSNQNLTITLKNRNNQVTNQYAFTSLELVNVNRQTNTDTPNTVTLTYRKTLI